MIEVCSEVKTTFIINITEIKEDFQKEEIIKNKNKIT